MCQETDFEKALRMIKNSEIRLEHIAENIQQIEKQLDKAGDLLLDIYKRNS